MFTEGFLSHGGKQLSKCAAERGSAFWRQDRRTLVMLGLGVFLASSGRGMCEVDKIASTYRRLYVLNLLPHSFRNSWRSGLFLGSRLDLVFDSFAGWLLGCFCQESALVLCAAMLNLMLCVFQALVERREHDSGNGHLH